MTGSTDCAPLPVIRKLDEKVVNRIAAGEVIQRPSSALKEMLENSLDAGATQITVTVKDGGLKVLQIQDNGHGIRHEDLPILCHRHTTSKLKEFEDLETIATLGFRGEALSSISFVSHMTVTTMTAGQQYGWKVAYKDSEMEPPGPKPCAAVKGTTILVEDLFYNVPTRKKALKNTSEEYSRILDIMSRYAIYNSGVGFSCKRQGESRFDVHTLATASRMDNIRTVFGSTLAKELLAIKVQQGQPISDDTPIDAEMSFQLEGYISSANHAGKKSTMILFINGRAVECSALKRSVELVYSSILPKASKAFLFFDLKMPSRHVEVNVHPTKREVGFLYQDEIIEAIREAVEAKLLASNHVRTFAQARLPFAAVPQAPIITDKELTQAGGNGSSQQPYYRPDKLVRTDHKSTSMEAFLVNPARAAAVAGSIGRKRRGGGSVPLLTNNSSGTTQDQEPQTGNGRFVRQRKNPPLCELTSIRELVGEMEAKSHDGLTDMIKNHTFVGMADDILALIQHDTKLYLLDTERLSRDLFYQQALRRFSSVSCIHLQEPASVEELAFQGLLMLEARGVWQETDGTKEEVAHLISQLLQQKADMLRTYLNLGIDEQGRLTSLPLLIDQYTPDLMYLPHFILDLAESVDWEEEKACFQSLAQVLANFYCIQPKVDDEDDQPSSTGDINGPSTSNSEPQSVSGNGQASTRSASVKEGGSGSPSVPLEAMEALQDLSMDDLEGGDTSTNPIVGPSSTTGDGPMNTPSGGPRQSEREWAIQHVVFPAMKMFLRPPYTRATDGSVIQLTSLEKLYRVFERC